MKKMNLINRDEIHFTIYYPRMNGKREIADALEKAVKEAIFKLPVIDAEPVKHGTWKEFKLKTGGHSSITIPYYECSECGGYMDADRSVFKYCPYCGAKMDGKQDAAD